MTYGNEALLERPRKFCYLGDMLEADRGCDSVATARIRTTTTTTKILWSFFWDHPGEPMPEENFWTLWCKGRLTEADTLTIRLGATPSGLTSAHLHHPPIFYRPEALPAAKPTVSKHWRQLVQGSKVHVKCFVSTCPRETGMSSHQNWKAKYRSRVRSYLTHGSKSLLIKVQHKLILNRTERNTIQRVRGFNVKERKKMRSSLDIWNVHMVTAGQRWKQMEANRGEWCSRETRWIK